MKIRFPTARLICRSQYKYELMSSTALKLGCWRTTDYSATSIYPPRDIFLCDDKDKSCDLSLGTDPDMTTRRAIARPEFMCQLSCVHRQINVGRMLPSSNRVDLNSPLFWPTNSVLSQMPNLDESIKIGRSRSNRSRSVQRHVVHGSIQYNALQKFTYHVSGPWIRRVQGRPHGRPWYICSTHYGPFSENVCGTTITTLSELLEDRRLLSWALVPTIMLFTVSCFLWYLGFKS